MQERFLAPDWIEHRSIERRRAVDAPIRVLGTALRAYGEPTTGVVAQRGVWMALALRVLSRPNRCRKCRTR